MNLTVINKNINQQNSDANKELQHSARHFGPHKSIGITTPDTPFDDIERKQGNKSKAYITNDKGRQIVCRILRVQVITKP